MKLTASLLPVLCFSLVGLVASSCKKCKDEAPRARIANNGTQVASVQVKTSGGNTINVNNVAAGATSEYASYAAGQTTFTLKINNVDYVKAFDASQCHEYTVAIDRNNAITVTDVDRND